MSMAPGSRLGPYEIVNAIGAGGMGEVFRARDTKLNRDVAIKVLPEAFAHDHERLARFTREAQTLASLNHPNIAAIYGIEEVPAVSGSGAGSRALVMELVEGEDLSAHLERGPIPIAEALPIARQIAEALEAAHDQGIIHRDLKPANIKVRTDGTVKVLDFGLAKAMDPAGASNPNVSHSPTLTHQGTLAGIIIGTAAYMSPEQAKGKAVDRRADIWAFGVVLYEMLTGKRAFKGDDVSETLASVLKDTLSMDSLPSATPPRLKRLIERCLDRDLKTRLRDIGEARVKIARIEAGGPDALGLSSPSAGLPKRTVRPWIVATATFATAFIAVLLAWASWRPAPPLPETRVDIVTPATDQPANFALSPDGRQIVFVASGDGASRLWLRSLATTTAHPLLGTEGALFPFWAPDSRAIGFFAGSALKRLDLGGGAPQTLASVNAGRGGAWNADGVIVFAADTGRGLVRVSATGGAPLPATTLGPQQTSHRWPQFLPDGRRFLYYAAGPRDTAGIYLGALDGSAPTRLTLADSASVYLPSGWLLWVRGGALVAQRLDLTQAALSGEPVTLADGVATEGALRSAVSVAATGLVAYRTGAASQRQLTWFDRSGTARGTLGDPDDSVLRGPRVSADGRRVVVDRTVQGNTDIWLLDGERTSRVTFDAAFDERALWSPDGSRIVFRSNRAGPWDLYQKLTNGAGVEERLVGSDQTKAPTSWSADGRFVLYLSVDPQTNFDLWVVPMAGDRTPSVFLKTPFRETQAAFSPDGRFVAYQSNESGRDEIYVRPFVPPGAMGAGVASTSGQWQVSTAGGIHPVWRPDGKELDYLNPAGEMMAAPITVTGSTIEPGAPVRLFPTRIVWGGVDAQQGRQYDVARDGRFLINTLVGGNAVAPITLLQNWNPAVKK